MDEKNSDIPQRQELQYSNEVVQGDHAAETITVPEDVNDKVKQVITTYPDGLSRERFRTAYNDIHGVRLNVLELGFAMLEGFLQHLHSGLSGGVQQVLKKICRFEEPSDDAGPEVIKDVLTMGRLVDNKVPEPKRRNDVMELGDKINRQTLPPDVKEGELLEVIVAEVFTPYRFWIQLKGETSAELDSIMDEMDILYDGPDSEQFKIPDSCVVVGLVCPSLYGDGNWHRAYIKAMVNLSTVEVFYVDYGTAAKVKKDTVRYLHKKFGDLPGQGIEARLAGIKPEGGLRRFTKEMSYRFLQHVRMPPDVVGLVAVVKGLAPKLTLWLVDTSTNDLPEGVAINQALVDEGLAEPDVMVDGDLSVNQKRSVVNHLVPLRRPVINCKSNITEVSNVEITAPSSQSSGSKEMEIGELQTRLAMLASTFKATKHPDVVNQFVKLQEDAELKEKTNPEDGEKSHHSSRCPMKLPGEDSFYCVWLQDAHGEKDVRDPEAFLALVEGGLVSREIEEVRVFPIKLVPHILNILLPAPASELKKAL